MTVAFVHTALALGYPGSAQFVAFQQHNDGDRPLVLFNAGYGWCHGNWAAWLILTNHLWFLRHLEPDGIGLDGAAPSQVLLLDRYTERMTIVPTADAQDQLVAQWNECQSEEQFVQKILVHPDAQSAMLARTSRATARLRLWLDDPDGEANRSPARDLPWWCRESWDIEPADLSRSSVEVRLPWNGFHHMALSVSSYPGGEVNHADAAHIAQVFAAFPNLIQALLPFRGTLADVADDRETTEVSVPADHLRALYRALVLAGLDGDLPV